MTGDVIDAAIKIAEGKLRRALEGWTITDPNGREYEMSYPMKENEGDDSFVCHLRPKRTMVTPSMVCPVCGASSTCFNCRDSGRKE